MNNPYCTVLGISIPSLERVKSHPAASSYALLIVALLERGGPMTLPEVAERIADAGIAPAHQALASLKRSRPGRSPVYRDGDDYFLDPYDYEADLWAFRLGLRPARAAVPALRVVRPAPEPEPLPGPDVALQVAELDEAWASTGLYGAWSAQRLALCVLDAHGGPMAPDDVVAFVAARARHGHVIRRDEPHFGRRGAAVTVLADGRWAVQPGHAALASARNAVRERLALVRKWAPAGPDPAEIEARQKAADLRREAHAAELAALRRVLVHAFPPAAPEAVVLVDVAERSLRTFVGPEVAAVPAILDGYDAIGAVEVRGLLRALGMEVGARRLHELGPPQKTMQLGRRGRTLKITLDMLVRGSCGIRRPFTAEATLRGYAQKGQVGPLARRLGEDARSLLAYYEYGRLHGAVRLRWRAYDEMIRVPWSHWDEGRLYHLMEAAQQAGARLDVVLGAVADGSDPWSAAVGCRVEQLSDRRLFLVDRWGRFVDEWDVQLARIAGVRAAAGTEMTGPAPGIYQMKVTLADIRPPIWRRFQVSGGATLDELHDVLQTVMGWERSHLYAFRVGDETYVDFWLVDDPDSEDLDATTATLAEVAPVVGARIAYEYDFGDDWQHELRVEKILPAEAGAFPPRCLEGARACPPEDCGGVWGYAELLEVLADPRHEDHLQMREWLGGPFDAEAFDVDEVNARL